MKNSARSAGKAFLLIGADNIAVGLGYPARTVAECKLLQVAEFQVENNRIGQHSMAR